MVALTKQFRLVLISLVTTSLLSAGCNRPSAPPDRRQTAANVSPSPRNLPMPDEGIREGAILAVPNPVQVCDGSGLGKTTLTYSFAPPIEVVEVRVGSPAGDKLTHSQSNGTVKTGKWIDDGTIFYLQDVSDGRSLTPDHTLATITVKVTTAGCS